MKATLNLRVTFDYDDEYSYAETLTEVIDRAREFAHVEIVSVERDGQVIEYVGGLRVGRL